MRKYLSTVAILVVVLLANVIAGCGSTKESKPAAAVQELNVCAAISMKEALVEIGKSYEATHPNVKIVYNFASSGTLQKQIEQGAPADLFISAAEKQMNELEKKNLIDKTSRKNLLQNQLVLIVPESSQLNLRSYEDLNNSQISKIAIGEPETVPAGTYAKQVLSHLGLWDKLNDKLVRAKDVRTVLSYVETGNVEAGIVYKTDAAVGKKVKIAATAPQNAHEAIIYPAAVIAGTKQPQLVADFLNYLSHDEATKSFEKYGFSMSK